MINFIKRIMGIGENILLVEARAAKKRREQDMWDWMNKRARDEIPYIANKLKNRGEAITSNEIVARHFHELGFTVDGCNWDHTWTIYVE